MDVQRVVVFTMPMDVEILAAASFFKMGADVNFGVLR
jgi:hypothetical protein